MHSKTKYKENFGWMTPGFPHLKNGGSGAMFSSVRGAHILLKQHQFFHRQKITKLLKNVRNFLIFDLRPFFTPRPPSP